MNSVHEIRITSQRCNGLGGVAVDEACDVLPEGGATRADAGIQDVEAAFEVLPQAFDRIQRGAGGRQPHQDDVLWHLDTRGHRRRRLIQEHEVEAVGRVLTKLAEQDGAAGGIEAGQLPPQGLAGGRFHGGGQPGILIQGCDDLPRLHPLAREPPRAGPMEAEPAFILAEAPDRRPRGLASSGRHGAQTAGALRNNGRGRGHVFFAWLGRGRFSLALSWECPIPCRV